MRGPACGGYLALGLSLAACGASGDGVARQEVVAERPRDGSPAEEAADEVQSPSTDALPDASHEPVPATGPDAGEPALDAAADVGAGCETHPQGQDCGPCAQGALRCSDDARGVEACDGESVWRSDAVCADDSFASLEYCRDAACVPSEATAFGPGASDAPWSDWELLQVDQYKYTAVDLDVPLMISHLGAVLKDPGPVQSLRLTLRRNDNGPAGDQPGEFVDMTPIGAVELDAASRARVHIAGYFFRTLEPGRYWVGLNSSHSAMSVAVRGGSGLHGTRDADFATRPSSLDPADLTTREGSYGLFVVGKPLR